jgi:hypothetical protein
LKIILHTLYDGYMEIQTNYIAVALAAVASMVIGFVWYGPMLFAKPWMKYMGYSQKDLKKEQAKMGPLYGISFVLAVLTAFVLSYMIVMAQNFFEYPKLSTGLITAFWMWLGFVMPVQATSAIFSTNRSMGLFLINTGYQLACLLVMGLILGLM